MLRQDKSSYAVSGSGRGPAPASSPSPLRKTSVVDLTVDQEWWWPEDSEKPSRMKRLGEAITGETKEAGAGPLPDPEVIWVAESLLRMNDFPG